MGFHFLQQLMRNGWSHPAPYPHRKLRNKLIFLHSSAKPKRKFGTLNILGTKCANTKPYGWGLQQQQLAVKVLFIHIRWKRKVNPFYNKNNGNCCGVWCFGKFSDEVLTVEFGDTSLNIAGNTCKNYEPILVVVVGNKNLLQGCDYLLLCVKALLYWEIK